MAGNCNEADIAPAICAWLDGPPEGTSEAEYCRLIVCLWEFCGICAKGIAADFRGSEAEDLASDYLSLIKLERRHRPCPVPDSKSALTKNMRHVLREELSPAWSELRSLLSESLWELERQGTAKCLGGAGRGVRADQLTNKRFTRWGSTVVCEAYSGKPPAADVLAFAKKADTLPHFYPSGAKGWHGGEDQSTAGGEQKGKGPRVIAPKNAKWLATELLKLADGWVTMEDLLCEFQKHVHMLEVIPEPESTDDKNPQDTFLDHQAAKQQPRKSKMGLRHAATEDAFWELVSALSDKVWKELQAEDLTTIACQYVLAKTLLGRKMKLAEFGDSSTVFDQKKSVLEIFREVLSADDFSDPDGELSAWHDKLWAEVLRHLAHSVDFCNLESENPDPGTLER